MLYSACSTTPRSSPALMVRFVILLACWSSMAGWAGSASGQITNSKFDQQDKFRQLEEILPTPNDYRTASGSPGYRYWQQSVDYLIDVSIDEKERTLAGSALVTYRNSSPDPLSYVWLQLDANINSPHSDAWQTQTFRDSGRTSLDAIRRIQVRERFDGGIKIKSLVDEKGNSLPFTIVQTMMRIDLPAKLASGDTTTFRVDWSYAINNSDDVGGRTGYEFFEKDGNCIFEMAQWFPRACAYTDVNGWQHKQYLGSGEFTLEFGNYEVRITVPDDHFVAATGELRNAGEVLSEEQRKRLEEARTSSVPCFVVTPAEALENQATPAEGTRTWIFEAENVRDFAFATSRKFAWDAMGVPIGDKTVMAMSFYPNEGEPLWSKYSTQAVAHTLEVYSKFTFDYPWPVAISVNGPVGGMEYPMICFNGPRPEEDGTYSARTKYGLISVVIHEVGHNWFPMIVNNDERQWTWMDEGLNTFLQFLAEQEWEEKYPSHRGEPGDIVEYMISPDQVPVMTNSDSLLQFGANAYAKPATALNILRETVMGRELFDFAFREYANRWKFRRPMPADFFRTMEDASGVDLDWFWRGWFYSTDHVDLAIAGVSRISFDTGNAYLNKPREAAERSEIPESMTKERNRELPKRIDRFPELRDFYNDYDELGITADDEKAWARFVEGLTPEQRKALDNLPMAWLIELENVGGLVMPVILEIRYEDGTTEIRRIPAEIWRHDNQKVRKLLVTDRAIAGISLDPRRETADADLTNNLYPPRIDEKDMTVVPALGRGGEEVRRQQGNPMRDALKPADDKEQTKDKKPEDEKSSSGGVP